MSIWENEEGDTNNKELQHMFEIGTITNLIKDQIIQWNGHIIRLKENESSRIVFEWVPQGKRPQGRSRNIWLMKD